MKTDLWRYNNIRRGVKHADDTRVRLSRTAHVSVTGVQVELQVSGIIFGVNRGREGNFASHAVLG